jgi:hypothetical protein
MVSIGFLSTATGAFNPATDWFLLGLAFLLLLASWGLIFLCGRLMEDGK